MTRAAVVLAVVACGLAVLAGTLDIDQWAQQTLWFAALAAGTFAIIAVYGVAITWARRRKRLWG